MSLRTSTLMWGLLQLSIVNHREGVELGYRAGEEAYQDTVRRQGEGIGLPSADRLNTLMDAYFAQPRYQPRTSTANIVAARKPQGGDVSGATQMDSAATPARVSCGVRSDA